MERLLHANLAAATALILFVLVSRASSAAVAASPALMLTQHQRALRGKAGDNPSSTPSASSAANSLSQSRPLGSLTEALGLGEVRSKPNNTRQFSWTDSICYKCNFKSLLQSNPSSVTSSSSSSTSASSSRVNPLSLVDHNQMLTEEEVKALRLERFKAQILEKMHLREKPEVRIRREELPSVISSGGIVSRMLMGLSDPTERPSPPPPNTTIILSTKSEPCGRRHNQRSSCFVITLEASLSEGVSTATLWLWRVEDGTSDDTQALIIKQVSRHSRHNHGRSQGTIIAQNDDSSSSKVNSGWVVVDISNAARNWASEGLTEVTVEVACPSCNGRDSLVSLLPDHKPFVIITLQQPKVREQRSTGECSTSSVGGCCRDFMHVTVAQMGWGDWILQPTSFDFYYCRGHCLPAPPSDSSNSSIYIGALQNLIRQQPQGSPQQAALLPCCSPTRYTPIDIMYIKNSSPRIQRINDLIVESCGCNG